MQDGRRRKARLLPVDQRRIAGDDAGLLQRTHPAPARRGRHADIVGEMLVAGAAVLLEMGQHPRVLFFNHDALSWIRPDRSYR